MWKLFLAKQWLRDVEFEGNVDADKALEEVGEDMDMDDGEKQGEDDGEGGKEGKKAGKGGKGKK